MAQLNRTGTYIAFAAEGGKNVTETDYRYYNLMTAMNKLKTREFSIVNSHDKVRQIRDGSSEPTIMKTLKERIKASKNFFLLVGKKTKDDDDFVPAEIEYAAKTCGLPIIVCYVDERDRITGFIPGSLKKLWPASLKKLIDDEDVKTIHIPFRELIMSEALDDYDVNNQPLYACGHYKDSVYDKLYEKGKI